MTFVFVNMQYDKEYYLDKDVFDRCQRVTDACAAVVCNISSVKQARCLSDFIILVI